MITAIVSILVESHRIPEVAQRVVDIEGVDQVYSVTGDVDLIAVVRVRRHEDLAEVIADQLSKVDGVRGTTTNIAFKTYSKRYLDVAFDLGIDGRGPQRPASARLLLRLLRGRGPAGDQLGRTARVQGVPCLLEGRDEATLEVPGGRLPDPVVGDQARRGVQQHGVADGLHPGRRPARAPPNSSRATWASSSAPPPRSVACPLRALPSSECGSSTCSRPSPPRTSHTSDAAVTVSSSRPS